jgi:2-haloacid dehalogenase
MNVANVKALCFDTGGTILDWHTGIRTALAAVGARHGIERDWANLANEIRRRSLKLIVNHGEHAPATMNFDDAHRDVLDQVLADNGLGAFTTQERRTIWWDTIHSLKCWPDFPASLARLRGKFICVSFTLLSFRIVMDTARQNGISWDAVISCEAIGKYKVLPEAYKTCAKFLQLDPSECCMVACHNFDLRAAKARGYQTAFVRRPDEWGTEGPPDPEPDPHYDLVVASFPELVEKLGA